MPSLFDPVQFGALKLRNRVIMAPLTRCRASEGRVPNDLMREYYVQRASAGLIITEATAVTPKGVGYRDTPGLWSDAQVEGWKKVTQGVHEAGGTIVTQLWHVGRVSHPLFLDGDLPVAPSAIAPEGRVSLVRPETSYVTPRALETSEIPGIIEAYRKGAENARRAGFDGVEIHGANGYLLDQFLHDGSNKRTDQYGGSIENRARLMLEVTDAVISVWGADRVGMHLNLMSNSHSMSDSNPEALFTYVASELGKRKIAFLFARDDISQTKIGPQVRKAFGGNYVVNEAMTFEAATGALARGDAEAASFGKPFIANPDLVERLQRGAPLNALNGATIYAEGATGYTDYPALEDAMA
ncbi:alkene reductase [Methylovirgula sp. 4M-Z18]|uniref:alkene reductase n=1 Tax=Methylovirgula sp. 4M-Z18 TaxID=2293567 RepID=UPI000E2E43C5|nr:alkene reductase [Methylovirgula sp. 4M-Z18]RFB80901.1 alkene reductase [Methylovirgula sp. 4M-Z18]